MNKVFIEAKDKNTSEYHLIDTILSSFFSIKEVEIVPMDGISNLFKEAILNQIHQAQIMNDNVLVLADADTVAKKWGFAKRKQDIEDKMLVNNVSFPFFLYPNHRDDGDVEVLMESVVRRDLHSVFFDCFEDYEKCIQGVKDSNGQPLYNTPNLKGKLHTYMTAQKLSNNKRKRLGHGDWQFDDPDLWDLKGDPLQPLIHFFKENLI